MATTKATTKKKTTRTTSSTRKKSSNRKRAKSTEQLRKEAIADIDRNLANADGKVETKATAKATKKKTSTTKGKRSTSSAKAATNSKKKPATKRAPGILDHAASILAASREPMSCKEIVEQAISKHGWKTSGATPWATLYAAITREIAAKGKDARFTKVDRGRFTSNANGKGA